MKSERAGKSEAPRPSAQSYQAFFEALEHPAALCDLDLTLLATNPAFELLCGVRGAAGENLGELLVGVAGAVPGDGATSEVEVDLGGGQSVTITLSRKGDTLAVMARNPFPGTDQGSLAAAGRALVGQARTEQALLELGREVAGSASEEQLVEVVARGVKDLFPGRFFCIRIIDTRTCVLTSLYAEGRLLEDGRDLVVFRKSAAEKTHLDVSNLPPERVRVTSEAEVPLLFHDSVRSICAPLVASSQLVGVLNVEYPRGLKADLLADARLLVQLANQVAVGVRNAKLIDELTFVRKYLEELLENANALILVANRERQILVFNRLLSTLTGLPKEQVLGRDLLGFVPESELSRVQEVLSASLKGERVSNFETRLCGRDGQEVRVSLATSSVMSPQGEVEGVIAIGQDLTEIKELEQRVVQAGKLASLGQLAASVAHEINNPMTAVATYADALLQRSRGLPNADQADQEKLRKILDNSKRILRFTGDLVSYARPAQDQPRKVELHSTLDLAVSFCDHVLSQQGISVERSYGQVPAISGVKGNLVQVFVNLITNACHAMKPGGKVFLTTREEASCVLVEVRDTGVGIEPRHLEKIFEPFFTTKPDGRGTGLGLSIVQGIVEKHGGNIGVQSEPGRGTTFVIQLPLQRSLKKPAG